MQATTSESPQITLFTSFCGFDPCPPAHLPPPPPPPPPSPPPPAHPCSASRPGWSVAAAGGALSPCLPDHTRSRTPRALEGFQGAGQLAAAAAGIKVSRQQGPGQQGAANHTHTTRNAAGERRAICRAGSNARGSSSSSGFSGWCKQTGQPDGEPNAAKQGI